MKGSIVPVALDYISRDGKILLATRGIRSFGYGFLSVMFAVYLTFIGFSEILVGAALSATLLGSAVFTTFVSVYGDRVGRRLLLVVLALLMAISGIIFAITTNEAALLAAAVIGTLSPTGAEIGSFLPLEQAILPQTTTQEKRNSTFANYNVIGQLSSSAGALFFYFQTVLQVNYGVGELESYHLMFIIYSMLALGAAGLYLAVSSRAEAKASVTRERTPLSPQSRTIVAKLSALFGVDAFAGGFVLQSIISDWFKVRYNVPNSHLAVIFFVAGIFTTLSFYAAVWLAKHIGLLRTMVFTHIPSNVFLILVPVANTFVLSMVFYLARQAISQMDVPTRQSYTVGIVAPEERTTAAGVTAISRNVSQGTSPSLAGYAQHAVSLSTPFFIGGTLKIVYDVAVYFNFRKIKPPEERG